MELEVLGHRRYINASFGHILIWHTDKVYFRTGQIVAHHNGGIQSFSFETPIFLRTLQNAAFEIHISTFKRGSMGNGEIGKCILDTLKVF